jgi:hypothetical protein
VYVERGEYACGKSNEKERGQGTHINHRIMMMKAINF